MHPHPLARDVGERRVDGADDALDEAQEIAERPVHVGDMALEREVGAVELQQEAMRDDRLVFDAERRGERGEIGLLAGIMLVQHGGSDDAGRGCRHKGFDEA